MQLHTCNAIYYPPLSSLKVAQISAAKLFYCFVGRNAWWSKWVQRYYEGCMHSSIESAKKYSEGKRVQGSVFYIEEVPALVFEGDGYCLAVTQINNKEPLADYSAIAITEDVPHSKSKIEGFANTYLRHGASFEGVHLSFDRHSRFWKRIQPARDSIIYVMAKEATLKDFVALKVGDSLLSYKSESIGSNYFLNWTRFENAENRISPKAILTLYSDYNKVPSTKEPLYYMPPST